jgi:hypothetical protein
METCFLWPVPPLNPLKGTLLNMEAKSPSGDLGAELARESSILIPRSVSSQTACASAKFAHRMSVL